MAELGRIYLIIYDFNVPLLDKDVEVFTVLVIDRYPVFLDSCPVFGKVLLSKIQQIKTAANMQKCLFTAV